MEFTPTQGWVKLTPADFAEIEEKVRGADQVLIEIGHAESGNLIVATEQDGRMAIRRFREADSNPAWLV